MVPQYTKDHLKSIISLSPDWPGNDPWCFGTPPGGVLTLPSGLMIYSPQAMSIFSSRIDHCTMVPTVRSQISDLLLLPTIILD